MVYKIINEWKSEDGTQHELKVYRYNYSWDCLTTYVREGTTLEIRFNAIGQLIAHSTQELSKVEAI